MPERSITDATGDRWDVSEERSDEERFRLRFRHQSGRRHEVESRLGVNALSDRQLLDMVAEQSNDRAVREGPERSADPDGTITG